MYETLANLDLALAAVLLLVWLLLGHRAGRTASRRRTVRVTRALLAVGVLLVAARISVLATMSVAVGWDLAAGQVLVGLPVLLAGVVPVVVGPRLRSSGEGDRDGVTPIRTGALAAVLAFWIALVTKPVPPYVGDLAFFLLLLAVGAVVLRTRRHAVTLVPGRRLLRGAVTTVVLLAVAVGGLITASRLSVLPDAYPMMAMMSHDGMDGIDGMGTDVRTLTGPVDGVPDRRFTLTAAPVTTRLASGAVVEGWAFDGSLPGPELRVHQGELVEVTLVNHLPTGGVTLHWHGVDVANAADGVAGLTQDAVPPGGSYVYRFRAPDVGTYWYHSHQQSAEAVERGLFGSIVVLPPGAPLEPGPGERTLVSHRWVDVDGDRHAAFGSVDGLARTEVSPGTPVRLRVVNSDASSTLAVGVAGTPFRLAAVDGHELHEPGELRDRTVRLGAGARVDVTFPMPDHPVVLAGVGYDAGPGLVLAPGPGGEVPVPVEGPDVDLLTYGTPTATPFDATTPADRSFTTILDERPGFYDGTFGFLSTIDGASFPDTPMPMVREGDLVRVAFVNRSHNAHPMHLHGHHALVLSRDGVPATGSPWWVDTLQIEPGQRFEVAFRADNPGLWMDHCHNLDHAAHGMTMHLGYEGVTSSLLAGRGTPNQPE